MVFKNKSCHLKEKGINITTLVYQRYIYIYILIWKQNAGDIEVGQTDRGIAQHVCNVNL